MSEKVWAFYDNPIKDTKDLAKNVPTVEERPDHWLNRMFPDGTWTTRYDSSIPPPYKSSKFIKGDNSDSSSIQPTTLGFQEQETFAQNTSGVTMSHTGSSKPDRQTTGASQGAISKEINVP